MTQQTAQSTRQLLCRSRGTQYSASLSSAAAYYMADGTDEWLTAGEGETVPAGFKGYIAVSSGSLKNESGDTPTKDTVVGGFRFTVTGSAVVDEIRMTSSYKKG